MGLKSVKVREEDYKSLKELKRDKSFPEYLNEVVKAVKVIENVRKAFKKVTGKNFSLEEIVKELVALGIIEYGKREIVVNGVEKDLIERLRNQIELASFGYPEERGKSLEEGVKNFYYIPDRIIKKVKEGADRYNEGVWGYLLECALRGAEVGRNSYFVVDDAVQKEIEEVSKGISQKEKRKFEKEVEKFINKKIRLELKKLRRKK